MLAGECEWGEGERRSTGGGRGRWVEGGWDSVWSSSVFHKYDKNSSEEKFFPILKCLQLHIPLISTFAAHRITYGAVKLLMPESQPQEVDWNWSGVYPLTHWTLIWNQVWELLI